MGNKFKHALSRFINKHQTTITILIIALVLLLIMFSARLYVKSKTLEKQHNELTIDHQNLKKDFMFYKDSTVIRYKDNISQLSIQKTILQDSIKVVSESKKRKTTDILVSNGIQFRASGKTIIDLNKLGKYMRDNRIYFGLKRKIYKDIDILQKDKNIVGSY